ncbi:PRD domain-containing protein [Martelella alba]|uniref:PRD domain-containing protein n=2 Tax=Martelella alba TaxID=2590451 RepID=A0ABY2SNY0_9HYPH|nr:PRD domain-containing protein [Martelella alba]
MLASLASPILAGGVAPLYADNRLHKQRRAHRRRRTRHPGWAGEVWTRGDYPRTMTLSPDGGYLYAMNQRSDNITRFRVAAGSGYRLKIADPQRFATLRQSAGRLANPTPRTAAERVNLLLVRFLTSAFSLKLEDIADEWFVSRGTLQNDMAEVRERLARYRLRIETRPRYGMKLFGAEPAIRTCLTDVLLTLDARYQTPPLLETDGLNRDAFETLSRFLHHLLAQSPLRLTDEGEHYLSVYCTVAARRIANGFSLSDFEAEESDPAVTQISVRLAEELKARVGKEIPAAEEAYLRVNIAARRVENILPTDIGADDDESLVDYILSYINTHYYYNLRGDEQLCTDLLTHIKTMMTRVKYQITIPNPLLANIKQHYPMAYDVTLAAVTSWGKYTPYVISENEIGFLVLHIGVGLERHYDIGYQRHPQVVLVCDSGNSTVRMIQALLVRKYPQISVTRVISSRDYEKLPQLEEDFVVSTVRLEEKNKPVMVLAPFPTDYQLEQLGKLVLVDRTRPYMLEKFFDARHFMIVEKPLRQADLFRRVCGQLEREGWVDRDFHPSVVEREAIVSTLLGDGIALPHSLGLLAKKTVIYTILAPGGIPWGDNETAYVIFLLTINKTDYEEAMAIYELFVNFVRSRAMPRLRESRDFAAFKAIAMDSLSRA